MVRLEINRIINQIEHLHNNNNWVGFNLYEVLDRINDESANLKLPNFNHTIHQIARHLVTDFVVLKRLQGINYELTEEENWIPTDKLCFKWADTVNAIKDNKNAIIRELQNLSDESLDKPILKDLSSVYENLHGYIQHSYYHFGQIVIMAKYIENSKLHLTHDSTY
jgi:uncharacterized damage-inducible protein DinB